MPSILVISDLHCTSKGKSHETTFLRPELLRGDVNKHPVESLLKLRKEEDLTTDLLLCPGDVTDKVDAIGFNCGVQAIVEISAAFKCKAHISTVGNHDVDSGKNGTSVSSDPFHIAKNVNPAYPFVNKGLKDGFWEHGISLHELKGITVLNISSVRYASDSKSAVRGVFSAEQKNYLSDLLKRHKDKLSSQPWVAQCHHHPISHEAHGLGSEDLMKNGEGLLELLIEADCDLVIHGHKHHTRISYFNKGSRRLPILAAGSFSHHMYAELRSYTSNVCHIVTLNQKGQGTVQNWRFLVGYGWKAACIDACGVEFTYGFSSVSKYSQIHEDLISLLKDKCDPSMLWKSAIDQIPDLIYLDYSEIRDLELDIEKAGFCIYRKDSIPWSLHQIVH